MYSAHYVQRCIYITILFYYHDRMAEWSKAPCSGRGLCTKTWVRIPLLSFCFFANFVYQTGAIF
ncbi:hypothetical protein ENBRE01_3514 [Enteropsectra breve]|nr:hypothetical protein ENBRE01_3514 [Enteropsectra breve]